MRTRCKDGDIALVVGDHEGLEGGNLGRFVRVYGAPQRDPALGTVWEFEPVGLNQWCANGALFHRDPFSLVHPDRWLVPVSRAWRGGFTRVAGRGGNAE